MPETWVGDLGLIPGLRRSPGGGHGNPVQCSCLENPHVQRSLAGCSPWGCKKSDRTQCLSTHFLSEASCGCPQLTPWDNAAQLLASLEAPSSGGSGKEPTCQCARHKTLSLDPWVRKIPWRRKWQPTPVFLTGESHGQRSLVGYSP